MFVERYRLSKRFRVFVLLLAVTIIIAASLWLSMAMAQSAGIGFNPKDWFASLAEFTAVVWSITHFLQAPFGLKGGSVRVLALLVGVVLGVIGSAVHWNDLSLIDAVGLGIAAAGAAGGVNDGISSAAATHGAAVGAAVSKALPAPADKPDS